MAVFSRNPATGALTFLEFHKDGVTGVDGLDGTYSVAVSPDGNHLYAAGASDNAVAVFSRNMCNGLQATRVGTKGSDTIMGTSGDDVIVALGGGDIVLGLGGNDTICLGPGGDKANGGPGDDWISGGPGHDRINGGSGQDTVLGTPAPTWLWAAPMKI